MAEWVVDKGLDVLLAQINAAAPGRNKGSDGSIGDAAHQSRDSDHNPESPPPPGNPDHQVDARDFTHDPAHNADMAVVTESIRVSRDRRVAYVIFNKRIFSSYTSTGGRKAWEWGPYTGTDPHTGHAHVSVNDGNHDQTQPWKIGIDTMATMATEVHDLAYATFTNDASGRPAGSIAGKIETMRTTLIAVSAQVKVLGEAMTTLKLQLDRIEAKMATGGTDPEVFDQAVRDAVRTELNATRLTAG